MSRRKSVTDYEFYPTEMEHAVPNISYNDIAIINKALDKWEAKNPGCAKDKSFCFGWQKQAQKGTY